VLNPGVFVFIGRSRSWDGKIEASRQRELAGA
jgi:hypothetical protein